LSSKSGVTRPRPLLSFSRRSCSGLMSRSEFTLTPHHRAVVLEWLDEVFVAIPFELDTRLKTREIFEKMAPKCIHSVDDIQLFAIACVMIACKLTAAGHVFTSVRSCRHICANAYTLHQIATMELCILEIKTVDNFVDERFICSHYLSDGQSQPQCSWLPLRS
jgi:hypothetical protein